MNRILLKITFTFLILCQQTLFAQEPSDEILNTVHILETIDPNESFNDLEELDSYFIGKRVIAMGESTHGTHEFSEMRHRVFRYLVENHDFNTFYLEADYVNCTRVNEYIHGKEDTLNKVVRGISIWPWQTYEMAELIEWMRLHNHNNPEQQISFIGVDMQRWDKTLLELERILQKYGLELPQDEFVEELIWYEIPQISKRKEKKALESFVQHLQEIDVSEMGDEDKLHYTNLLVILGQISEWPSNAKSVDYRDKMMAENLLRHLRQSDDNKGFYWAHNEHVKSDDFVIRFTKYWDGSAGEYIDAALGEELFVIGQEFDYGSFNAYFANGEEKKQGTREGYELGPVTIEASDSLFFSKYRSQGDLLFIECDHMPDDWMILMHVIGAVFREGKEKAYRGVLLCETKAFDAVIFIRKSTPTRLISDESN